MAKQPAYFFNLGIVGFFPSCDIGYPAEPSYAVDAVKRNGLTGDGRFFRDIALLAKLPLLEGFDKNFFD